MPAKSEKQRKFMGIVKAIQSGDLPKSYSKKAADVAKTMSPSDVDDFVDEEAACESVKIVERFIRKMLRN